MEHGIFDRYGLPEDDPEVAEAVGLVSSLPEHERDKVLQALVSAIYSYQRTDDPRGLLNFARDFTATVRLRLKPGYDEALAAAPTTASGPSRSVKEIFEQVRR